MNVKILTALGLFTFSIATAQADLSSDLLEVQQAWAKTNYETTGAQQEKAFEALISKAKNVENKYPENAEPKVWVAIVLSSDAAATGGLGALGKVKEARNYLEKAEKIDASALNGSVYTSLGSLYYQVPGWPIAFGDDDKADAYLKKALVMNPEGIDPNYFYGDFMLEEGEIEQAIRYLKKAQLAPARTDRALADAGRQQDIAAKLAAAQQRL